MKVLWLLLCVLSPARALRAGGLDVNLGSTLKSSLLLSQPEAGAVSHSAEAAAFWRLRLEPTLRYSDWLEGGLAYEQRLQQGSAAGGLGTLGTAAEPEPMLRLAKLDAPLGDGPGLSWWHELDRAWLGVEGAWGGLIAGRQAIAWGRGAVFAPSDLLAPLSPFEPDQEWRRGVDALRLSLELGEGFSLEGVGAWGADGQRSACLGRLRGKFDGAELEALGGVHFEDRILGGTFSAPLGDAELHAESIVHLLLEPWIGAGGGSLYTVPRSMLGASYNFVLGGRGLFTVVELYDNGFGLTRAQDLAEASHDPQFLDRIDRGQLPVLARRAGAFSASLGYDPDTSLRVLWLFDPFDGSGSFDPGLQWDAQEDLSLLLRAYVPYGRGSEKGVIQSQYGSSPLAAFLQLKFHR